MKIINKITSALLGTAIAASVFSFTAFAAEFKDVSEKDWYYSSVQYASDAGIMDGVGDGRFAPRETLTRAMAVTLLYRIAGKPDTAALANPFSDVGKSKYYTEPVKWAYANGVVTGKSAEKFAPNDNITRAEFATILYRYAGYTESVLPEYRQGNVKDIAKVPSYAKDAVSAMYRAEIINGRSDGSFDPSANINRAESAAMMERYVKASDKDLPVPGSENTVADGMTVEENIYENGNENIAVLTVENTTNEALTVNIKTYYKDAAGKILKTETKTFEGFAAGWKNSFAFMPGIAFDSLTYELTTKAFSGEVLTSYIHISEEVSFDLMTIDTENPRPAPPEIKKLSDATAEDIENCTAVYINASAYQTYELSLDISLDVIILDEEGCYKGLVMSAGFTNLGGSREDTNGDSADNLCYKQFIFPKELVGDMRNGSCIFIVDAVTVTPVLDIPA